jgi:hypothetical protein
MLLVGKNTKILAVLKSRVLHIKPFQVRNCVSWGQSPLKEGKYQDVKVRFWSHDCLMLACNEFPVYCAYELTTFKCILALRTLHSVAKTMLIDPLLWQGGTFTQPLFPIRGLALFIYIFTYSER